MSNEIVLKPQGCQHIYFSVIPKLKYDTSPTQINFKVTTDEPFYLDAMNLKFKADGEISYLKIAKMRVFDENGRIILNDFEHPHLYGNEEISIGGMFNLNERVIIPKAKGRVIELFIQPYNYDENKDNSCVIYSDFKLTLQTCPEAKKTLLPRCYSYMSNGPDGDHVTFSLYHAFDHFDGVKCVDIYTDSTYERREINHMSKDNYEFSEDLQDEKRTRHLYIFYFSKNL